MAQSTIREPLAPWECELLAPKVSHYDVIAHQPDGTLVMFGLLDGDVVEVTRHDLPAFYAFVSDAVDDEEV